jgi:hypothetical protein
MVDVEIGPGARRLSVESPDTAGTTVDQEPLAFAQIQPYGFVDV